MKSLWNWYMSKGLGVKILLGVVAFFVVMGFIGAVIPPEDTETASDETSQTEPTAEPTEEETTEEPESKPSPKPSPKPKPYDVVDEAVGEVVEDAKLIRDESIKGFFLVEFPVSDNFTMGMIRTGVEQDVLEIVEAVDKSGVKYTNIAVRGMFPLVDEYGNEEPGQVLWSVWARGTIEKINWDAQASLEPERLAERWQLHPDMQE